MSETIVLFEDEGFLHLLPLVWWRSVFELRVGRKIQMDLIAQRTGLPLGGVWTREWYAPVAAQRCGAPANRPIRAGAILVNGRWTPEAHEGFPPPPCVGETPDGIAYIVCDEKLARSLRAPVLLDPPRRAEILESVPRRAAEGRLIRYPWDIIADLPERLERQWRPADATIESEIDLPFSDVDPKRLHVGERTSIHRTAVLDTSGGCIFISHDVQIGAHAVIEGPAYIGPGTRIRPHAHLYNGVALGPVCRVGGEVCRCVLHGYTNKQHAGFLGHAIVGSWVNFGAGTTNSNLKNTYGTVRVPLGGHPIDTGMRFFGAVIADHAKLGINTAIPTGAVIGLGVATASSGLLPKYLPSFSWVTDQGIRRGDPNRVLDIAAVVMSRRDVEMTDEEVELLIHLGEHVAEYESPAR